MVMVTKPGNTPLLRPKPGPNEPNPLLPAILATVVLCSILTTVCTAIRLVAKRLVLKNDFDDYMLIVAWVASIALELCLLAAGIAGFGQHARHLPKFQYARLDKYTWALEILYPPSVWLAKASLLLQQIRIYATTKIGRACGACHILNLVNLAFYASIFFSLTFKCYPAWKVWNPSDKGHCIDWKMLLVVSSALNVLSDFLTLICAIWTEWHLQMVSERKIGVIAIIATGLIAFISSICRLVYTTRLASSRDVFYIAAQTELWGIAEIAAIILCSCLPEMPRCLELIHNRYSDVQPASPLPIKSVRKSKIFKIGSLQNSVGIGSVGPQEVNRAWLKSPYECLSEEEDGGSGPRRVIRDLGSKRTVGIEMASRDQLNAKSRVASMV